MPEQTRPRWRITKRGPHWPDPDRWTVLYDDCESLDQNSDAASIEGGQFAPFEAAVAAFWQAWWDLYARRTYAFHTAGDGIDWARDKRDDDDESDEDILLAALRDARLLMIQGSETAKSDYRQAREGLLQLGWTDDRIEAARLA